MYIMNMKKPLFTAFFLILTVLLQSCSNPSEPGLDTADISNFANYTEIDWVSTSLFYDTLVQKNLLSIIYFTDDACSDGILMENNTFKDSAVIVTLNSFYNIARISTSNDSLIQFQDSLITGNIFFKKYNLVGVPSLLILDSDNRYFGRIQAGYYPTDSFLVLLEYYIEKQQ